MSCTVSACCFISDLRTAAGATAIFSLLANVGVLAYSSYNINVARQMLQFLNSGDGSILKDFFLVHSIRVELGLALVMLLMSIAAILLDAALFSNACKSRRDIVQFWTHGHAVVYSAYFVYLWLQLIKYFALGYILNGLLYTGTAVIGAAVTAYFCVVVHSYGLKLHRTYGNVVSESVDPSTGNIYHECSERQ